MKKYFFIVALGIFPFSLMAKIRVAVTIDDLPTHGAIPSSIKRLDIATQMLKALKKHQVPEVYGFINAQKVQEDESSKEILKLWVENGYPLGNHTFSHASINDISIEQYKNEVLSNEKLLSSLGSKNDWKYFRYPYLREGNTFEKRNSIREFLKTNGYKIAQVTIDFEDWAMNAPYARCSDKKKNKEIELLRELFLKDALEQLIRAEKMSQSLFKRSIDHILLLHVGAITSDMMDMLLKKYKEAGVEFISLSEAVKDKAYEIDPKVLGDSGSEFTYQVMRSRGLKLKDLGLDEMNQGQEKILDSLCR